ncbi:stage III sporulation protein AG [Aneurinibacillus terranovensis]|uniref:stage III sporulation protein AG n=1 Tax=Aneurinibacillus terranovensis TaxID=278991 RepID=UPI0003FC4607|nr:stage III sporulation protein AG [Aneurinibacillus terranovensis]
MSQEKRGWRQLFNQSGEKRINGFQWLIVIGGIGVGIMLLSTFLTSQHEAPSQPPNQATPVFGQKAPESYTMADYEAMYEKKLKAVLTNIEGVSDVTVMVNVDSTEETVVEKNRTQHTQTTKESDKGATREVTDQSNEEQVVMKKQDNNEEPVVVKTIAPKIRGVIVVAKGAENMQVKAWILEAVQKVLAVPSYKISILPKK